MKKVTVSIDTARVALAAVAHTLPSAESAAGIAVANDFGQEQKERATRTFNQLKSATKELREAIFSGGDPDA